MSARELLGEGLTLLGEAALAEAEREHLPVQLKRCVLAVSKERGLDTRAAFPICVASLQKKGYLKAGTLAPTAAGEKRSAEKEGEKGAKGKLKAYERLLKHARKAREG